MADLPVPVRGVPITPSWPDLVAPPDDAPSFEQLFRFMRDAELRFDSLRMRIADRTLTARGEETETIEVWLRHPGFAKVVGVHGGGLRGTSTVWLSDGREIRTYDPRAEITSVRPVRPRPAGIGDPALPSFGRVYEPLTDLEMESLPETFIHPHGFCRNVLATAELRILGTIRLVRGRDAWLIRADHPRTTHVLNDRPDRWLEVGVDRVTGLILLLIEHVGDRTSRHAVVTLLDIDPTLGDDVFVLHSPRDATAMY
jgi:hypothetical protein